MDGHGGRRGLLSEAEGSRSVNVVVVAGAGGVGPDGEVVVARRGTRAVPGKGIGGAPAADRLPDPVRPLGPDLVACPGAAGTGGGQGHGRARRLRRRRAYVERGP